MRLTRMCFAAFGLMLLATAAAQAAACVDTSPPAGVIIADDGAGSCGAINRTGNALQVTGTFTPSATPTPVKPGALTLVTLDVKTVTTGGTPVTAISAGHRSAGGLLCNPVGATINLGINEIGTAAGTTSSGDTTFVVPGQCYTVAPAAAAVSVITSDSSHPFSGYGMQ